jgi:hypothetical protein
MVPSVSQRSLAFPLKLLAILGLSCSLAQARHIASPFQQLERLRATGGHHWAGPAAIAKFVQEHTRPHERVIVSWQYGHIIALDAGVTNLFPFSEPGSVVLKSQLDQLSAAIDRGGINRLFGAFEPEFQHALVERGFIQEQNAGIPGCSLWTRMTLARHDPRIRVEAKMSALASGHAATR